MSEWENSALLMKRSLHSSDVALPVVEEIDVDDNGNTNFKKLALSSVPIKHRSNSVAMKKTESRSRDGDNDEERPPTPKRLKSVTRECSVKLVDCRYSRDLPPVEYNNNTIKIPIIKLNPEVDGIWQAPAPRSTQRTDSDSSIGSSASSDFRLSQEKLNSGYQRKRPDTGHSSSGGEFQNPSKDAISTEPSKQKIPALCLIGSQEERAEKRHKKSQTTGTRDTDGSKSSIGEFESAISSFIYQNLSRKAKEALEKIKNNRVKDPFLVEIQSLVDEFYEQVQSQSYRDVDLSEAAVLLDGVAKIYNRQAVKLQSDVLELAAYTSATREKEKRERHKRTAEEIEQISKEENNLLQAMPDAVTGINEPEQFLNSSSPETQQLGFGNLCSETLGDSVEWTSERDSDMKVQETPDSTAAEVTVGLGIPNEEAQNQFLQSLVLDTSGKDSEFFIPPLDQVKTTCSGPAASVRRRESDAKPVISFRDILNPSFFKLLGKAIISNKNRKSKSSSGPPTLQHYLVIPIIEAGETEGPPTLDPYNAVPRKRQRIISSTSTNDDIIPNNSESTTAQESDSQQSSNDKNSSVVDPTMFIPKGVDLQLGKLDLGSEMKADDLIHIHSFIQQLHYLSLAADLTGKQRQEIFRDSVSKMEQIFKSYNLRLDMQNSKTKDDDSASSSSATSSNNTIQIEELNLDSFHESLSESYKLDDSSSIMERTKEKTRKDSKKRLNEMLTTVLRPIVRKHSNKALIHENSEAFFKTVDTFRYKMKRILENEERRNQFELIKYEQEVLEVASKEFILDDGGLFSPAVTKSPSLDQNDVHTAALEFMEPLSPCSETSSKSVNSNGTKWVRLEDIFSNVKNLDKQEAARYFCALLGLLSFQNLDMDYDKLYSDESAEKVKKALDHSQDTKYPRGAKIVQSRCPDIDKDEIYISALSSVSRTVSFRQMESGVSADKVHPMSQEEFLQATNSLAAFEVVKAKAFEGELFSKRATARQNNLLAKQAQALSPPTLPAKQ